MSNYHVQIDKRHSVVDFELHFVSTFQLSICKMAELFENNRNNKKQRTKE